MFEAMRDLGEGYYRKTESLRLEHVAQILAWTIHTPMETQTLRRVRARGLQACTPAVGRVPSRGVQPKNGTWD